MFRDDETPVEPLDRYWDQMVQPASVPPDAVAGLDPALQETVRRFHARDDLPAPNPTFVHTLREELMHAHSTSIAAPRFRPGGAPVNDDQASSLRRFIRPVARQRRASIGQRVLEVAALAALILVIIIGTWAGRGFPPGQDGGEPRSVPRFAITSPDAGTPAPAVASNTGTDLANAARTGQIAGSGPEGEPTLRWRVSLVDQAGGVLYARIGSDASSTLAVEGERIYLTGDLEDTPERVNRPEAFVAALDAASGEEQWRTEIAGFGVSVPTAAAGTTYVSATVLRNPGTPPVGGLHGGVLYALDAATGEQRWQTRSLIREGPSAPTVAGDTVYLRSMVHGTLYAFDAATGGERWQSTVPADDTSDEGTRSDGSPVVAQGIVYTPGTTGTLYALDARTGDERWQVETAGNFLDTPVIASDTVYVTSTAVMEEDAPAPATARRLYALDAATGQERWTVAVDPGQWSSPSAGAGLLFLAGGGDEATEVVALDAASGEQRWVFAAGGSVFAPPVMAGDSLYVTSGDGGLYALDSATGELRWRVEAAGPLPWEPTVVGDTIYIADTTGTIYAVSGTESVIDSVPATPVTDEDISGLATCDIEPRPELEIDTVTTPPPGLDRLFAPPVTGTPAASIGPIYDPGTTETTGMRPEDVPTGEPADAKTIAAITDTIERLGTCSRPGRELQVVAFFTDDYFRRSHVTARVQYNGYSHIGLDRGGRELLPLRDVRLLPDGRVGVLHQYNENFANFVIFAEQAGRWLIDEIIEISDHPEARG